MRLLLASLLTLAFVPAASAAVPSPCALLTKAQVANALATKVDYRTAEGNRFGRSCTWHGRPLSNATSAQPQVTLRVAQVSEPMFKKGWRSYGSSWMRVRGVGQFAHALQNGEYLAVWSHGTSLIVEIHYALNPLQATRRLAIAALAGV